MKGHYFYHATSNGNALKSKGEFKGVKPDGSQPAGSDAQSPGPGANPAPSNT
jgi:hypothetical protein